MKIRYNLCVLTFSKHSGVQSTEEDAYIVALHMKMIPMNVNSAGYVAVVAGDGHIITALISLACQKKRTIGSVAFAMISRHQTYSHNLALLTFVLYIKMHYCHLEENVYF